MDPDSVDDATVGDDHAYQYLKENDSQGLSNILQDRMRLLVQQEKLEQTQVDGVSSKTHGTTIADSPGLSKYQLAGPFDLTAPILPPHQAVSDHLRLIREYDWAATPMGPMSHWTTEFRRVVNFMLADSRAACLWWGPERTAIYNEPYRFVLAQRHPAALANPVHVVWPELVNTPYGRSFDLADQTGRSSSGDRGVFFVERDDFLEEVWASWDVVPIFGSEGINGYYNVVIEQTHEVLTERRMATLHSLGQATLVADEIRDFWQQVLHGLDGNHDEVPFAALYGSSLNFAHAHTANPDTTLFRSFSEGDTDDNTSVSDITSSSLSGSEWTLEGTLGFELPDETSLPNKIDVDSASELLTPLFRSAMDSKRPIVLALDQQCQRLRNVAKSRKYNGEQCRTIVFFPIRSTAEWHKSGFLLLGLNTRRTLDPDYERFISTLHLQLTNTYTTIVIAEIEARRARITSRSAAKDRIRLIEKLAATQQEAQVSELRFKSMADLAPIGIFTFDARGTLLYANQYWNSLIGNSSTPTSSGMTLHDALLEADRGAFHDQWEDLLAGKEVHFECRLNRPYHTDEIYAEERLEGETWVLIAAYPVAGDTSGADTINEIFGCLVDISRQKWMEGFHGRRLLEQQERTRQQENFMDSTSHEARNPLAAITLCADDLYATLKGLPNHTSPTCAVLENDTVSTLLESVEIIIACAKHQKRIIDDVLTLSKLDSGMLTTSPTPIRPTDVVGQALRMFQAELKRSDVTLNYTVTDRYRECNVDWVMLDSTRFLQILINLLNNAIKFTKPEPSRKITVTLEASHKRPQAEDYGVQFAPPAQTRPSTATKATPPEISVDCDNVYIYVAIVDTGPGLVESEIENLFQRFQQASPKTYAQYGGSGLGLWISKELCAKLGGQIGVASGGGRGIPGSTFAFYVQAPRCSPLSSTMQQLIPPPGGANVVEGATTPTLLSTAGLTMPSMSPANSFGPSAPDVAPPPADANTPKSLAGITVLVVEDNLTNQRVMRKQLLREGFKVLVANHGKEALETLYPAASVQVVLMDIEMPVMDGLECTRAIRLQEKGTPVRLPILGVTANVRAEQQAAALEAGMDSVVTKPFHMGDLLGAIGRSGL